MRLPEAGTVGTRSMTSGVIPEGGSHEPTCVIHDRPRPPADVGRGRPISSGRLGAKGRPAFDRSKAPGASDLGAADAGGDAGLRVPVAIIPCHVRSYWYARGAAALRQACDASNDLGSGLQDADNGLVTAHPTGCPWLSIVRGS